MRLLFVCSDGSEIDIIIAQVDFVRSQVSTWPRWARNGKDGLNMLQGLQVRAQANATWGCFPNSLITTSLTTACEPAISLSSLSTARVATQ